MRTINKTILYFGSAVAAAFLLAACGGGGGGSDTNWGIDGGGLPQCSADIRDASAAVKINAGTIVTPLEPNTTVRVWHYQNSDKLICVITGSASISLEEGS